MPGGGHDRVGICELSKFGQRVDEQEYAPDQRCGGLWVSLISSARRASASASRISPACTSAIARRKQPWASAISHPRGRARSISAAQAGGVEFATGDQEDGCRRAEDRVGVVVERAGVKGGG